MAAATVGDSSWVTIISDNATPGNGTYAWYILTKEQGGFEPRAPLVNLEMPAEVNFKEKYYDLTAIYRISNEKIRSSADFVTLRKALDYWDSNDSRLYLSVKNTWGTELAARSTKADAAGTPITLNQQYRGKLFNFRWSPTATGIIVGVEFHYTTA